MSDGEGSQERQSFISCVACKAHVGSVGMCRGVGVHDEHRVRVAASTEVVHHICGAVKSGKLE